jgi:hypothetical protein
LFTNSENASTAIAIDDAENLSRRDSENVFDDFKISPKEFSTQFFARQDRLLWAAEVDHSRGLLAGE